MHWDCHLAARDRGQWFECPGQSSSQSHPSPAQQQWHFPLGQWHPQRRGLCLGVFHGFAPAGNRDVITKLYISIVMSYLFNLLAHPLCPTSFWWPLWNKNKISLTSKSCNKGKVSAVSTHDFKNKGSLMTRSGGDNSVNGLDNSVQCRVSANGHVSSAKVIVNWADHADNVQVTTLNTLLLCDSSYQKYNIRNDNFIFGSCHHTSGNQLIEQRWPLLSEQIGTSETAVTSNDN